MSTRIVTRKRIVLDNDFEPDYTVTRKAAATGETEAATGLAGLTVRIATTPNGSAIHASLSKAVSERGTLGKYYARFEGDDLRTHLAKYAGESVWVVFGNGTDIARNNQVPVLKHAPADEEA